MKNQVVFNGNANGMSLKDLTNQSVHIKPGFVVEKFTGNYKITKEELLSELRKLFVEEDLSEGKNKGSSVYLESTDIVIKGLMAEMEEGVSTISLETFCKPLLLEEVKNLIHSIDRYVKKPKEGVYEIEITQFYETPRGRDNITFFKDTEDFKSIRSDFYPKIKSDLMTQLYTQSNESILLLTGEPGTGKTCFVKKTLHDIAMELKENLDVVYVKDPDILKQDNFWTSMTNREPDVLVLDDLDDELTPRTEGRNDIVNNMLSFADGLFDLKTKIIITSNLSNSRVDSAIIRPGRCFAALSLPQLSAEEALEVWVNGLEETTETFIEVFGDEVLSKEGSKISQASLMSEFEKFKKVGSDAFLLDPSINILAQINVE